MALPGAPPPQVSLVLFTPEGREAGTPLAEILLDPETNRTGAVWHVLLPELNPDLLYGFRMTGPFQPELGQRFKTDKILLDPFAKARRDYDAAELINLADRGRAEC